MLVLVDPAKHAVDNKLFVLQLIELVDGSYVVYSTRWGRTSTSACGQAFVKPFDDEDHAVKEFLKKFKEKTGLQWEDSSRRSTKPAVGKKYRFILQNFGEKQLGCGSTHW